MMSKNPFPDLTIIWLGRFLRSGGYGVATRGLFRSLKEASLNVVGIDTDTNKPIDDSAYPELEISGGGDDILNITATSKNQRILVVYHELPPHWKRLKTEGNVHSVGYVVTETEQIPFGWTEDLLGVDNLWVATEFNRNILKDAGVPASMLTVIPHAIDTDFFKPKSEVLPFRSANDFRFLCIASNFNRKDIASVVRAYADAFDSGDNVSLIIKLPGNTKTKDFKKFLTEAVHPWVDFDHAAIPHIMLLCGYYSDEKMLDLYSSCHGFVSLERGKGWDLPSLEALLLGMPCIAVGWGGNTDFQNATNSEMIAPSPRTVYASEDLVVNRELYSGNTWAGFDIADAAKAMLRLYENYDSHRLRVLNTRKQIENLSSFKAVSDRIEAYLNGLENLNFKSRTAASITFLPKLSIGSQKTAKRFVSYEGITDHARAVIDAEYVDDLSVEDWVSRKRKIWGKWGPVLPSIKEQERIQSLKNKYYGESIFVVGNGPSMKKIDTGKLNDFYSIAANKIYLLFEKTDWRPDFYTTLDWRVTPDNFEEINSLKNMTFLFPHRFKGLLREGEDVFWYESLSPGETLLDKFESDINRGVRGGGTILVAALQQAFYLGFRKFFLLGVDVSYSIPSTVVQSGGDRFGTGLQINLESTADDDNNHFDPRYFGKGCKWHDPNVDEMKRGFQAASRAIEYLGGKMYNSTIGGNLNCVERMNFEEALEKAAPKKKAVAKKYADKKR